MTAIACPRHRRPRPGAMQRRGVLSVALLLSLMVGLAAAVLVLNWCYLVLAQRQLQHRADLLALAGAPGLLDPLFLVDGASAASRTAAATASAADLVDTFRLANNDRMSPRWQLEATGVQDTAGWLTGAGSVPNFLPVSSAPAGTLPTALKLRLTKGPSAGNPLGWLLGQRLLNQGTPDVLAESIAQLDGQVAGFRLRTDQTAPVVPLAIDLNAWRQSRSQDINHNGIRELKLRLPATGSALTSGNLVVTSYAGAVNASTVTRQVTSGVTWTDLASTAGVLGPASTASPLSVLGQAKPAATLASSLQSALSNLGTGDAGRRVWPLYDSAQTSGGRYALVGFVAGRVLSAQLASNVLTVTLEPCFLIHATAWTVPGTLAVATPPLVYRQYLAQ